MNNKMLNQLWENTDQSISQESSQEALMQLPSKLQASMYDAFQHVSNDAG